MTDHPDFIPDVSITYEQDMLPEKIDAKALAVDILRACFEIEVAEGTCYWASQVGKLRQEMGVDKFINVPDDRAGELLDRALNLLAELADHYREPSGRPRMPIAEAGLRGTSGECRLLPGYRNRWPSSKLAGAN